MRLAKIAWIGALALTACLDDDAGYYWWDETNDVWCYTYDDGATVCDETSSSRRVSCSDSADGGRRCEVYDGGYLCVFEYAPDGTMTPGACILIDDDAESPVRRDCEPANDGSLICQFQSSAGTHCVVIFDGSGAVSYDPCGYFVPVGP